MTESVLKELPDHLPAVTRFARSLTRNAADGDDLLQDTVERALSRAHQFQEGTNLRAWLFTICRSVFLNSRRKAAARMVHVEFEDIHSAIPAELDQEIAMEFEDVKAAFATLPLQDRAVIALVTLEGLKYEEAAQVLDVPVGTIRSRLSRARSKLMDRLEPSDSKGCSDQNQQRMA